MALNKAETIKQAIQATKERRKQQVPKVYQLKISYQNLNKMQEEWLNKIFLEAKWLYNYAIADIDNRLNAETEKAKKVTVKTPSGFEEKTLSCLSSQMKQGIIDRIKQSLCSLHNAKQKGRKVGGLKFKSDYRNIPLKQNDITFKVLKDKNRIKIQGLKKPLRVLGLEQLPNSCEIAKAELIKKADGYYVYVTSYINKQELQQEKINKAIGINFGVKHQLVFSNGMKINYNIEETERLKRLQRRLAKQKRVSKNYIKTKYKLQKEYLKIANRRKDIQNKIFALLKKYEYVFIRDEQIKNWYSGLFGKQIHNTGIGGIISMLKQNIGTLMLVNRYEATTKICSNCGNRKENIALSDRVYKCENCGLVIDRDLNSAINILKIGIAKAETTALKTLPTDCGKVTPAEMEASARILGSNPYIRVSYTSLKQEAP